MSMRVCGDRNQSIVACGFTIALGLVSFNHGDETRRHKTAGKRRLVHQKKQRQRIAVAAQSRRNETEIEREDSARRQHASQLEEMLLFIVVELVAAAFGRFDNDLQLI